ncbi:hypothetical protein GCM10028805_37730 [Spirosoma harenae]
MTIKSIGFLIGLSLLAGCTVKREFVTPQTNTPPGPTIPKNVDPNAPITGEWTQARGGAGGFANYESFKNFQYNFDIEGSNQPVAIQLTSDVIDVQYALFDPLGQLIDVQGRGRSVGVNNYSLNAGKYRIVVTADRRAVGKFSLSLLGTKAGADLIPSFILQSNTQNWGSFGGGGREVTFKNHFYTFDVSEDNTTLDVELSSADVDIALTIYDALGQQVASATGSRYQFLLQAIKKGTYTVMAGTNVRSSIGDYQMNLFGKKIANLKRVESQLLQSNTQNWGPLGGGGKEVTYKNHFYTFEVTEDNFTVDVELESPDTDVALYVYDQLGQPLNTSYFGDRSKYVILKLNKGTYSVMAATVTRGSVGTYNLRLIGKVQNLQRVESQFTTVKGTWDNKTSADIYSVDLTPNTSPLDIELTSSETVCQIDLQNSSGTTLTYTVLANNSNHLLGKNLAKATYLIKVYPGRVSGKPGTYTLNLSGRYGNFRKL